MHGRMFSQAGVLAMVHVTHYERGGGDGAANFDLHVPSQVY